MISNAVIQSNQSSENQEVVEQSQESNLQEVSEDVLPSEVESA
jgi:hypothetical protein